MKIGVVFPQTEFGDDPGAIKEFAQTAEALGYSHILIFDHVLGAVHAGREPRLTGPYTEDTAFHEPFVIFGFWAAVTSKIELATGVIILPQRQTALVAKQAAEIDLLSGGRLRLGVGTGWNYVEYDALGENFHNRGKRQEEQIELLRKLWSEPVIDYTGQYHRIERAGLKPMPTRQIPIWMGGGTEVVYRRAARIADGFILGGAPEAVRPAVEMMREDVVKNGRDPSSFGIEAMVRLQVGQEMWGEHAAAWRNLGASHLSVVTMGAGLEGPRAHIEALRKYKESVGF